MMPAKSHNDAAISKDDWRRIGIAVLVGAATAIGSGIVDEIRERIRERQADSTKDDTAETDIATGDETEALSSRVGELEAELTLRRRVDTLEAELKQLRERMS